MVNLLITAVIAAAAVLAYSIWHSWWLTAAAIVAATLIMHTLKPYLDRLSLKLSRRVPLHVVRDENPTEIPGRGVRVLVVTVKTEFNPRRPEDGALLQKLVDDAEAALRAQKPLFGLRYDEVLEKKLPYQLAWAVCGPMDSGMRRCYRSWLAQIGSKDFGSWKEDRELFLYDGTFSEPGSGETLASAVLFLFDPRLPALPREEKPVPAPEQPQGKA